MTDRTLVNHIVEEYVKLVRQGDEARRAGSAYDNPYREGTPAAMAWDDGWDGLLQGRSK